MPELPEVETIRRDLEVLIGHKISYLKILNPKTAQPSAAFLKKHLLDQKIEAVNRVGKLLIFSLSNKYFLLIHLKMTGQLIYRLEKQNIYGGHSLNGQSAELAIGGDLPNKHTRVFFEFDDGAKLFFNDLRKFGYVKLVQKSELDKIVSAGYGPEPLTKEFTLDNFSSIFSNHRVNLKALLLNQKLVAGLGNIYVDESLFQAGLKPDRLTSSLKREEITLLFKAINDIIRRAIKYRGTTFSDYQDASGQAGNFSRHLKVYGRGKQPCLKCGQSISKIKLAGRGTHYCQYCQK